MDINFQYNPSCCIDKAESYIKDLKEKGELPHFKNENINTGLCEGTAQSNVRNNNNDYALFIQWNCEGENHYMYFRFASDREIYKQLLHLIITHQLVKKDLFPKI